VKRITQTVIFRRSIEKSRNILVARLDGEVSLWFPLDGANSEIDASDDSSLGRTGYLANRVAVISGVSLPVF
jgi:hypothetical protein